MNVGDEINIIKDDCGFLKVVGLETGAISWLEVGVFHFASHKVFNGRFFPPANYPAFYLVGQKISSEPIGAAGCYVVKHIILSRRGKWKQAMWKSVALGRAAIAKAEGKF